MSYFILFLLFFRLDDLNLSVKFADTYQFKYDSEFILVNFSFKTLSFSTPEFGLLVTIASSLLRVSNSGDQRSHASTFSLISL